MKFLKLFCCVKLNSIQTKTLKAMKKTILVATVVFIFSNIGIAQINSPGMYTGGSGDYTNVINPQLKLQSNGLTNTYVRAVHLSNSSTISAIYNYQTGKDVYWGEPNDNGKYYFRGRDVIVQNSKLGIGNVNPITTLDVNGTVAVNNNNIYLRVGTDVNHGLGWFGSGKPFAGIQPDGPVLFGYAGGALGSTSGGQKTALTWNNNGQVTVSGSPSAKLNILTANNNDYALYVENGGGYGKGVYIKGGSGCGAAAEHALLKVSSYSGGCEQDLFLVEGKTGQVRAREILVNLNTWPDYVFKSDYELKSLEEVESFITDNSHLPGVPSEEEIVKGGVNLGEMDAILLQKIEELTLYMIEQQKTIKEQGQLIQQLSKNH